MVGRDVDEETIALLRRFGSLLNTARTPVAAVTAEK